MAPIDIINQGWHMSSPNLSVLIEKVSSIFITKKNISIIWKLFLL